MSSGRKTAPEQDMGRESEHRKVGTCRQDGDHGGKDGPSSAGKNQRLLWVLIEPDDINSPLNRDRRISAFGQYKYY